MTILLIAGDPGEVWLAGPVPDNLQRWSGCPPGYAALPLQSSARAQANLSLLPTPLAPETGPGGTSGPASPPGKLWICDGE